MEATAVLDPPVDAWQADPIGRLRGSVDEFVAVDPAELTDAALADMVIGLRREMDRQDAVFARLARAAHLRGAGTADGAASTAAWLARHARMRTGDARNAIDAGEVCEILPETAASWRDGEISSGAARTILGARVDGHDDKLAACEDAFLEIARTGSLRDLRVAAGGFRAFACADGTEPGRHDGLYLSRGYNGRHILSGELSDLAAETVHTALSAYTDPPGDSDTRSPAKRRADALVRICEVALAHAPDGRRAQAHVTIVVDWDTLTGRPVRRDEDGCTDGTFPRSDDSACNSAPVGHGNGGFSGAAFHQDDGAFTGSTFGHEDNRTIRTFGRGDDPFNGGGFGHADTGVGGTFGRGDGAFTGPIHPADLRRALCDCHVSRIVTGPDGLPLDAGRSRRTVPPALRRALVVRDAGCCYPGCDRPPGWCDAHHVVAWADGGPTDLANVILVCAHHHRVLHRLGRHATFDGHTLHIHRPDHTEVT